MSLERAKDSDSPRSVFPRDDAPAPHTPRSDIDVPTDFAAAVLRRMEGEALAGSDDPPPRVGHYTLLREVGCGGQGRVYLAQDTRLMRRVALKLLSPTLALSLPLLQRFRREAEVVSRLDHPGICGVFEAGVDEGVHYIAMRFVDGRSLADLVRESRSAAASAGARAAAALPDPSDERSPGWRPSPAVTMACGGLEIYKVVRAIELAARALHVAHEAGLVHRDVKPANIMIDRNGDPVLLDFGLAAIEDSEISLTGRGDTVGTPAYISPEQLAPRGLVVDRRSDVHALGVMLYECLTLRRPFEAPTREGIFRQILEGRPLDPRRLNPAIPKDLGTIVATALDADRNRRYASALDLAEDLRRFRELTPALARPIGPVERGVRWCRRQPVVASLAGLVGLLLIALTVWAVFYAREQRGLAARQRQLTEDRTRFALEQQEAYTRLEEVYRKTESDLYDSLVSEASLLRRAREVGYRDRARSLLLRAASLDVPQRDLAHLRAEVIAAMTDFVGLDAVERPAAIPWIDPEPPVAFRRIEESLWKRYPGELARSFDPRSGAVAFVFTQMDRVWLWRPDGSLAERRLPLGPETDVAFAADGRVIVVGSQQGAVVVDAETLEARSVVHGEPVGDIAVHPAGDRVALFLPGTHRIDLWSLGVNRLLAGFGAPDEARGVRFSADGRMLLAVDAEARPRVGWRLDGTPERRVVLGHRGPVRHIAFAPDGARIVSGADDGVVAIGDLTSDSPAIEISGHEDGVRALAVHPTDPLGASADGGRRIRLFSLVDGRVVASLDLASRLTRITALAFDARRPFLVAGGEGPLLRFRLDESTRGVDLVEDRRVDFGGVVGERGIALLGASILINDGNVGALWMDLDTLGTPKAPTAPWPLPDSSDGPLWWSTAGDRILLREEDGRLKELDLLSGRVAARSAEVFPSPALAFSADGLWVASVRGNVLFIWDVARGREWLTLGPEDAGLAALDFSPDGTRLAVGLDDGSLAVWDLDAVRGGLREFDLELPTTRSHPADPAALPPPSDPESFLAAPRRPADSPYQPRGWPVDSPDPRPLLAVAEELRASGGSESLIERFSLGLGSGALVSDGSWDFLFSLLTAKRRSPLTEVLTHLRRIEPAGDPGRREDLCWLLESLARDGAVRINCGGEGYRSPDGTLWGADRFFLFGVLLGWGRVRFDEDVAATVDDPLYQTERSFALLPPAFETGYHIPLPSGDYRVTLHFAEIWERERGKRVFDILLEGRTVLERFEPLAAGFAMAETRSFDLAVEDGALDLRWGHRAGMPKVSGIEIGRLRAGGSEDEPPGQGGAPSTMEEGGR